MSTTAVTGTTYGTASATSGISTMTTSDFLKLMVSQLSNQDPMNPVSNEEFASQLAQYSSLDETVKINSKLDNIFMGQSINQASALIGKTVKATDSATNEVVSGVVDKVVVSSGTPYLRIGERLVSLYDLSTVAAE